MTTHPSASDAELPDGTLDCHTHVFGPRSKFPYAEGRTYTPDDAPRESLYDLHDALGIAGGVVVQPACHGTDMSATLNAIAGRPGRYRGIALVDPGISDHELGRLNTGGIKGVRFNFIPHLGTPPDPGFVRDLAPRLNEIGWHIVAHVDASTLKTVEWMLDLGAPVVIDHMARMSADLAPRNPDQERLLDLLNHSGCWVKVSGVDRISKSGPPYRDAVELARRIVEISPDRTLWGTDWPHPNHPATPDDRLLARLVCEIAPEAESRRRILVHNPRHLFDIP